MFLFYYVVRCSLTNRCCCSYKKKSSSSKKQSIGNFMHAIFQIKTIIIINIIIIRNNCYALIFKHTFAVCDESFSVNFEKDRFLSWLLCRYCR